MIPSEERSGERVQLWGEAVVKVGSARERDERTE